MPLFRSLPSSTKAKGWGEEAIKKIKEKHIKPEKLPHSDRMDIKPEFENIQIAKHHVLNKHSNIKKQFNGQPCQTI